MLICDFRWQISGLRCEAARLIPMLSVRVFHAHRIAVAEEVSQKC